MVLDAFLNPDPRIEDSTAPDLKSSIMQLCSEQVGNNCLPDLPINHTTAYCPLSQSRWTTNGQKTQDWCSRDKATSHTQLAPPSRFPWEGQGDETETEGNVRPAAQSTLCPNIARRHSSMGQHPRSPSAWKSRHNRKHSTLLCGGDPLWWSHQKEPHCSVNPCREHYHIYHRPSKQHCLQQNNPIPSRHTNSTSWSPNVLEKGRCGVNSY